VGAGHVHACALRLLSQLLPVQMLAALPKPGDVADPFSPQCSQHSREKTVDVIILIYKKRN
jgi:hypothetical protein